MILRVCLSVARIELCRVSNQVSLLFLSADNYLICDALLITWIELQQNCVPIPNQCQSFGKFICYSLEIFVQFYCHCFICISSDRHVPCVIHFITAPPRARNIHSQIYFIYSGISIRARLCPPCKLCAGAHANSQPLHRLTELSLRDH